MTAQQRTAPAMGVVLLAAVLAGCGRAPVPADSTVPPPSTPPATQLVSGSVTLLWPVTDAAAVAPLQARVDQGAQPWLLDPVETAVSFADAAYGWRAPRPGRVDGGPAGSTVTVTDGDGGRLTVTLVQPGRTGPTGIWTVTAAHRG